MAGIMRGLTNWMGLTKSDDLTSNVSSPAQWLVSLLGGGPTQSGIAVGPASAMQCSVVWACVQALSEDVAKLQPVVYQGTRRGAVRKELPDHPLSQLFARRITGQANWLTPFEYWRFCQMNYLLDGNAYSFISRNERGEVIGLIPIPPGRVTIYEATDGDLFYSVGRGSNHEAAVLADAPLVIPGDYIMHDRGPSRDGIHGMSAISAARESVGLALAGERFAAKTFNSGARPSGILKHPKTLSEDAGKRLRAQFEERYGGIEGMLKTVLLEEGLDFTPVTMSNIDVQFIEGRRFQVEEIARLFRVPQHKIGALGASTNNNIEAQDRQYVIDTLMAHLERLESLMESRLLTDQEHGKIFIEFDVSRLLRGDMTARYAAYAVGRNWGWLSVNDILARENMNPVDGGDTRLQPGNMQRLGDFTAPVTGAPSSTAPTTTPAGAKPPAPVNGI